MGLLSEIALREALKGQDLDALTAFSVSRDTIVTPAAKQYLNDKQIKLVYEEEGSDGQQTPKRSRPPEVPPEVTEKESNLPEFQPPKRYETITGAYYDEKPEHMTAIHGPKLVNKDHPIIRFRGKIDSLEARILEVQLAFQKRGLPEAVSDLGEVYAFVQEILRCEVLNCGLEDRPLLGLSADELRERSHHPKKYFGINHFAPTLEHGEGVILLNTLRTQSREVELVAYDTFKDPYGVPKRMDIMRAMNRLSSLFYIMMFKVLAGDYNPA